jgi:Ca2+-binding EF-hand superfamily protein
MPDPAPSPQELDDLTSQLLVASRSIAQSSSKFPAMPSFFHRSASLSLSSPLQQNLHRHARTLLLREINAQIPQEDVLQAIWDCFVAKAVAVRILLPPLSSAAGGDSPPTDKTVFAISYPHIVEIRRELTARFPDQAPAFARYFAASRFLSFRNLTPHIVSPEELVPPAPDATPLADAASALQTYRIDLHTLFTFIVRDGNTLRIRINLSVFDATGSGHLREADLEAYLTELLPTLPTRAAVSDAFFPFYLCSCLRGILFWLDPLNRQRVRISHLLDRPPLRSLLQLSAIAEDSPEAKRGGPVSNWFSPAAAMQLYSRYLALDSNQTGLLDRTELRHFKPGKNAVDRSPTPVLTEIFVDRFFATAQTYAGEIDFKAFSDFVLCLQHREAPRAVRWFFGLLDIDGDGRVERWDLVQFFRPIAEEMLVELGESVVVADVVDELWDMIKPANPGYITLKDVEASGAGGLFSCVLTDLGSFLAYDSRESDVPEEEEPATAASAPMSAQDYYDLMSASDDLLGPSPGEGRSKESPI